MNDDVTVIVPVWNRRDLLEQLLGRLRAQTCPIAEILVVDNGSKDGSPEMAEARGARVVRMGYNAGFSRAVNRGIGECRTALLALVNNDVEPAPDWLERLIQEVRQGGYWYATGKLRNAARPHLIDGTWDALCRGGCAWRIGHGRPDGPLFSSARPIWFAPATAAVFRAELFSKIGLLDETFESYLEDVDLGLRCAAAGYRGIYVPDAVAFHQGSATLGRWHPETVRRMARNQVLLLARHYPNRALIRYAWPILVAHALWGLVAARHGAARAFIRGKIDGLLAFRKARSRRPAVLHIDKILEESEREIRYFQKQTGFDPYWRLYFFLTGGGAN